jgi:hypothetical protein
VAEVHPDLVGRNPAGQPESVLYEQINAMLLNEFLKEHRKGEEQDCKIQEQEKNDWRAKVRNSEFGCNGQRASIGVAEGEHPTADQQRRCANNCEESVILRRSCSGARRGEYR